MSASRYYGEAPAGGAPGGTEGADVPAEIAGILADRFVIERLAGRGGMGEVRKRASGGGPVARSGRSAALALAPAVARIVIALR